MKIYIDINDGYKCYASNITGELLEYEDEKFDGLCAEVIEGYVCKPFGYTLDGKYIEAKMVYPWKPCSELEKAQLEYELAQYKTQMAEAAAAYESGVNSI